MLTLSVSALGAPQEASTAEQDPFGQKARRSYSSPYLPQGHWVYPYIDLLMARGRIPDLPLLVQPYRRIDVAASVLKAEAEGVLSKAELEWVAAIKKELVDEVELLEDGGEQGVNLSGEFHAGLKAVSHTHRDLMRAEGDSGLFRVLQLDLRGDAPAVAGALIARWDDHYLNDPQFPNGEAVEFRECDPIISRCAYRIEEAYVEVQVGYARVFFGRMYRNWGQPGTKGLLLSDYAYSYDHIGYRFGSDRVAVTGLYAPLNDFLGDTARHFSSHRFDWRISNRFQLALSESVIYGGENRRVDFGLTNPVGVWEVSASRGSRDRNNLAMAEAWWRVLEDLVAYGAFMIDNTSVGNEDLGNRSGFTQYAAAASLQVPTLTSNFSLRGDITVVNSLAYRSRVARWEYYTIDNIGLARDKTDVIWVALQGDWYLGGKWLLFPRLDLMWKGEADITDPFPDDAFTGYPRLLVGVVEKTIQPALGGLWHVPLGQVRWYAGLNIVKNDDHVAQDWKVEGIGRVMGEVRVRF